MSDKYPLVCVDVETTGLSQEDEVVAISIRLLNPDGTPTHDEFFSYVKADRAMSEGAYQVNRITPEILADAPDKFQLCYKLKHWHSLVLGGTLTCPMGHNYAGFDKARVERLLGDYYGHLFHYHLDDSMILARGLRKAGLLPVDSCSLKELAKFFGIVHKDAHHASADTYVCAMVYSKLLKILKPNFITRVRRVFEPGYLGRV